jgi:hypothetical protein
MASDYQGFASAHAEKLARAIERGIPDTLRGMMWQLMYRLKFPTIMSTVVTITDTQGSLERSSAREHLFEALEGDESS